MAGTGPADDYFGASYIGHNPNSGGTTDYLNQLSTIHGMLSANASQKQQFDGLRSNDGPQMTTNAMGGSMGITDPNRGVMFNDQAHGNVAVPTGSGSWDNWSPSASMGSAPANNQANNATNIWRAQDGSQVTPGTPGAPPARMQQGNQNPWQPTNSSPYNYGGTNIPQDIQGLRTNLGSYLGAMMGQNGGQQPNYSMLPGSNLFNLGTPTGANEAYNFAANGPGVVGGMMQPGQNALSGLMNFNAQGDFSSLMAPLNNLLHANPNVNINDISQFGQMGVNAAQQYGQAGVGAAQQYGASAANAFGSAMPSAMNIAQTGGAPIQQLLQSLQDINNQGQNSLTHNLAQIREQYGAQGLGAGSDVSSALAQGASVGQAQIQSQQSSLLTNVLQAAAQNQLGGVNALQGIGQGFGQIGNMLSGANMNAGQLMGTAANNAGNLSAAGQGLSLNAQQVGLNAQLGALNSGLNILQQPVQNQLASAGIQLGAANALPQYGNVMNTAFNNSSQNMLGLAGLNQSANMYTNNAQYQNFLRQTQQLPPAVSAALGFATSYPPVSNTPSSGTSLATGAMGMIGSILPWLFM